MNALQSLSTSGVHAIRCSSVPCEKEGAGEAAADSNASATHRRTKGIGRSIQCFCVAMFIGGLGCMIEADTRRLIKADTLLLPLALVAKRLSLELSSCFVINNRTQKPPSHRSSVQALGTTLLLAYHVQSMRDWHANGGEDEKC
jgi:hypothetical protein